MSASARCSGQKPSRHSPCHIRGDTRRAAVVASSSLSIPHVHRVRQWVLTPSLRPVRIFITTFHLLVALCVILQSQAAPSVRLYPVDDSARDPAFHSFVKRLRSAVETRNSNALRKLVDPEVVSGPAQEETGWQRFAVKWKPDDANSSVWSALSDLLELGFTKEHPSLFVSPYLVWRFPRDLDRASYLVVIRDKAALRTAPSLNATVVTPLSFDIVKKLSEPERGEGLGQWVRVQTIDGQTGYLNTKDVMSPLMPRAQFGIRNGHWLLVALEGQPDVAP